MYDVVATGTSKVYETTMDAITLDVNDDGKLTVKFDGYNSGRARAHDEGIDVWTNYYAKATVSANGEEVANASALAAKSTAAVRLVDTDGNGQIDAAYVTAPVYGTVADYNEARNDFDTDAAFADIKFDTNRTESKFELYTFADNIAKDDVIAIDIDVLSGETLFTVSKLEAVTGKLTRVNVDDKAITVGGTAYKFFEGTFDGETVNTAVDSYTSDLGEELTLYTDGKYIVSATEGSANELGTNFAYVKAIREGADSADQMTTGITKAS